MSYALEELEDVAVVNIMSSKMYAKIGAALDEVGHKRWIFCGISALASTNHFCRRNSMRTGPIGKTPDVVFAGAVEVTSRYKRNDDGFNIDSIGLISCRPDVMFMIQVFRIFYLM